MSESSTGPAESKPATAAPEGKLIQIGGRQIRRHQSRALRVQQSNVQAVAVPVESKVPAPAPAPPPEPVPDLPPLAPRVNMRRARRRWMPKILTFLLLAVLPASIGILYYAYLATNQYVAVSQFAIRSQASVGEGSSGGGGLLGGNLANLGDTQIVAQYLHSDQLLRDIEDDVDIRALYSVEKADWWARLDPTVSREKLLKYWTWMCTVALDPTTGIITLSIRGFAPEDAKRISEAALAESEKLVNRLSERARDDAMKVANAEADLAYARVNRALEALTQFQEKEKQLNPISLSEASQVRISKLEQTLTSYEAELGSLSQTMAPTAPSIIYVNRRIAATKAQLEAERAKATDTSRDIAVPILTAEFDRLNLERQFSEKAYLSTLQSQEAARVEAGRQVKYLEAFVRPRLPEASLFPNRSIMVLVCIAVSVLFWLMVLLLVATIKEHV